MMIKKDYLKKRYERRRYRSKKKTKGSSERPRLVVFKSNRYIYVQAVDDVNGTTITSASSLEPDIKKELKSTKDIEASKVVGKLVGERLLQKNIEKVVFDRNGYLYHGRVKALADSAREAGLKF
jgi:large subunit ribosomal protein L18